MFATFASIGVVDCLLFLGEVSGFKIQYFGAPRSDGLSDSSESPVHGQQEGANGLRVVCYHPLFLVRRRLPGLGGALF